MYLLISLSTYFFVLYVACKMWGGRDESWEEQELGNEKETKAISLGWAIN